MVNNRHYRTETQVALLVAYDSLAYLTIVAAMLTVGLPGLEYNSHAWLHIQEFIEKSEHLLSKIDAKAAVELRTKIRENAAFLQDSINRHKSKEIS